MAAVGAGCKHQQFLQEGFLPELPEVEVVRRGLEPYLTGKTVEHIEVLRPDLRYPIPDLNTALHGHKLRRIERRAKYLLFFFNDVLLVWHLGMTGQFHVLPQNVPPAIHEHVRFLFSGGASLRYRDSRRFGYAGLLPPDEWQQHPWFRDLGPEPLADGFSNKYFTRCCREKKSPIKSTLMNARIVVGIGNIYACEALFRARIHPARLSNRISDIRLQRLHRAIRQVLKEAIEAGGSSINDFVHVDGEPGYFAHDFKTYGRAGEACQQCGKPIRRIVQSGRSSFYCPDCQR